MQPSLECFVESFPLKYRLSYGGEDISTSFGLTTQDMLGEYRLFLNNLHYRNSVKYIWEDGALSYNARFHQIFLQTPTSYMTFDIGSEAAYSYVEWVFYRFLQYAEMVADAAVVANMGM
jgi:hypothetical protein